MGVPSISERKHYRLVPGIPEEPTSTIVLTSKDCYFVDIRLLRDKYEEERNQETYSLGSIEWAFAGRSRTTTQGAPENGIAKLSHTTWDHWIDSKTDDPGVDEGDMLLQDNGDVFERGKQKHPDTGAEIEYEELWHDLEVIPLGKKQNRNSMVLIADKPERDLRGMIVKIGGWCQGIFKSRNGLTIERWEHRPKSSNDSEATATEGVNETRTHNDWVRTYGVGNAMLPCSFICSYTSGKIGLHAIFRHSPRASGGWHIVSREWTLEKDPDQDDWKLMEEYYW